MPEPRACATELVAAISLFCTTNAKQYLGRCY